VATACDRAAKRPHFIYTFLLHLAQRLLTNALAPYMPTHCRADSLPPILMCADVDRPDLYWSVTDDRARAEVPMPRPQLRPRRDPNLRIVINGDPGSVEASAARVIMGAAAADEAVPLAPVPEPQAAADEAVLLAPVPEPQAAADEAVLLAPVPEPQAAADEAVLLAPVPEPWAPVQANLPVDPEPEAPEAPVLEPLAAADNLQPQPAAENNGNEPPPIR